MAKKYLFSLFLLIVTVIVGISLTNCSTGIESSPDPGILRIILESDPSDTTIIIVTDTFTVSEKDYLKAEVYQGKAYIDTVSAVLYPEVRSTRQEGVKYNIIARENNQYCEFTIFETHVPPDDYNRIQFGILADSLKLGSFDVIKVESAEDSNLIVDLYKNFYVKENGTTEINVRIQPFKSIKRFKDTYRFSPKMEIFNVKYY